MNKYAKFLQNQSATAQQEIEHWATKCAEDPLHQLKWADSVFSAGGRLAAVRTLRWYLDDLLEGEDPYALATKAVVEKTRNSSQSSSATANLLNAQEQIWLARLAGEIERLSRHS